MKRIASLCLALGLAACATSAEPDGMVLRNGPTADAFPAPLRQSMCVRSVTGGQDTNPMWISKVDDAGFRTALVASMSTASLLAPESACKYPLDANLLGLSQPTFGLDMQVVSHINYKVYGPAGQPVLLETIDAPYTATFSDAAIGMVRVKRANEGSIRSSIAQCLEKLRALRL